MQHDLGTDAKQMERFIYRWCCIIDDFQSSGADINGGTIDGVTIGTNSAVTDLRVDNNIRLMVIQLQQHLVI